VYNFREEERVNAGVASWDEKKRCFRKAQKKKKREFLAKPL